MKKNLYAISAVLLSVFLLAACTSDEQVEKPNTPSKEAVEQEEVNEEEVVEEEVAEDEVEDKTIKVGETISFEDFDITINKFSLGKDYEGKDALVIDYSWENTGENNQSPFMTFSIKGYQDNVETDMTIMMDGVDLSSGQKDIKPGGKIDDGQDSIGLSDLSQPLTIELSETFSFNSEVYSLEINPSEIK